MDKVKEATKWLAGFAELMDITPEDLDEHVMDMMDRAVDKDHFSREEGDLRASNINNEGLRSQIAFLIEGGTPDGVRDLLHSMIGEKDNAKDHRGFSSF